MVIWLTHIQGRQNDRIQRLRIRPVFIGVDVGKDTHHAVAINRSGKRLFDKALPNDENKLRSLISDLKQHGQILLVVDQPATIGALPVAVARSEGVLSDTSSTYHAPHSRLTRR